MVKVTTRGFDPKQLKQRLNKLEENVEQVVGEFIESVAEDASTKMKMTIATTPSGLVEGKPDRIWTGRMYDAVKYSDLVRDRNLLKTSFGWLDDQQEYFLYQETGDSRYAGNRTRDIVPMLALAQEIVSAKEELSQSLPEELPEV